MKYFTQNQKKHTDFNFLQLFFLQLMQGIVLENVMVDAVCLHIKQIFRNNKKLKRWVFFPIEEKYKYFFFSTSNCSSLPDSDYRI